MSALREVAIRHDADSQHDSFFDFNPLSLDILSVVRPNRRDSVPAAYTRPLSALFNGLRTMTFEVQAVSM